MCRRCPAKSCAWQRSPCSLRSRNEHKVFLLVGSVEVNPPEYLWLCDHDAGPVRFKQPVPLRFASQRFDDEFNHASIAAIRDMITLMNLLACLVPERHVFVDGS